MRRLWLAIRIFFRTLFRAEIAKQVELILQGEAPAVPPAVEKAATPDAKRPPTPARSDALTLLAALQREARFIDFIQETLDGYSDAQIGAAARDVHRECGKVLQRMFALRPIVSEGEGAAIELPVGFDAEHYRLTGKVTDQPHVSGRLVHHGWEATMCELPTWTGSESSTRVLAPAEIEL